jgi:hypothetical protein
MIKYLLVTSMALLICAENCYGYIDMGAGSYMLQILLAGFLGGLYAFKGLIINMARKLLKLFINRKNSE